MQSTHLAVVVGMTGIQVALVALLYRLIFDDHIRHPLRWAALLASGMTCFLGLLAWEYLGTQAAELITLISGFLFAVLVLMVVVRDRKAVLMGERLIGILHAVDLQVNYALSTMGPFGDSSDVRSAMLACMSYVLNETAKVLRLDPVGDSTQICLVRAQGGSLVHLQSIGVKANVASDMGSNLRYGDTYAGIAGKAVTTRNTIYIPNLADPKGKHVEAWIPLESGELKSGSIISVPLFRGVGNRNHGEPLGALSVTSIRKHAFDPKVVPNLLIRLAAKLEALMYMSEIAQSATGLAPSTAVTAEPPAPPVV